MVCQPDIECNVSQVQASLHFPFRHCHPTPWKQVLLGVGEKSIQYSFTIFYHINFILSDNADCKIFCSNIQHIWTWTSPELEQIKKDKCNSKGHKTVTNKHRTTTKRNKTTMKDTDIPERYEILQTRIKYKEIQRNYKTQNHYKAIHTKQ